MDNSPRNVVVIGAGTMGSGIAAHLANLGLGVTLLDVSEDTVHAAFGRAKKAKPPHFYVPETADTVKLASIEHGSVAIREADWVCEAIVEKLEAKKALFSLIEPLLRDDAFVSTNTSGLEISLLCDGRSPSFRRRLVGTHFFNPPRYLKLLELIPTTDSDPAVVEAMTRFLEERCARRVVPAKDTPGFIANRFGMWSMFFSVHCAERLGLSVEEVDAITGPFMGRPRSGSFRLNDIVGLDIMQDIATNLVSRCPHDPYTKQFTPPRSFEYLLEKGWIGDKAGQGYYRREGRELMSLDLQGLGYRVRQEPQLSSLVELGRKPLAERLREGLELRDQVGSFLRSYLPTALEYAEYLRQDICHSVEDFDRVMMWGFGWEAGPFETTDMVQSRGAPWYQGSTMSDGLGGTVPRKSEPQFAGIRDFPVVEATATFRVRDMGDGVRLIGTTTKMGVFTVGLVKELTEYLKSGQAGPIVLSSESRSFSAGFDLQFLLDAAQDKRSAEIDAELQNLQQLGVLLSTLPTVAAVFGHCLGGGYEMATSCALVAAHPETQMGLPEAKVGLIPGGGGAARMRQRHDSSAKSIVDAVRTLVTGTVSSNADEARKLGFMRRRDVTVYHPDRLFTEAKRLALTVAPQPETHWGAVTGPVGGMIEQALQDLLKAGEITEHDHTVAEQLRHVFVKSAGLDDAFAKERAAFDVLLAHGLTLARIRHMLETGKPLRN
ncbi:MAG: enoyl-CoA hydratase/isomerase family protein [Armatimonadetes bacterium]|nr:enoyl-CoA hydratase/isomerase family protein [Armatimonadota bacterium]